MSEFTRQQAIGAGVSPKDSRVAHAGIHASYDDPAPERDWAWRLLYVGRLDPRKGVDTAVEALAHLPDAAHLTVVGGWDDTEEARLQRLAGTLGVQGKVTFAGQRGREELVNAYADADAVVFPVRWNEPWGLVPLEAMGRGRPVVATGRGGSAEYLRAGENCILFEADDAEGLAEALVSLADDEALRLRLRSNGRLTAGAHSELAYNEMVEREILDVVGQSAATARGPVIAA